MSPPGEETGAVRATVALAIIRSGACWEARPFWQPCKNDLLLPMLHSTRTPAHATIGLQHRSKTLQLRLLGTQRTSSLDMSSQSQMI